MATYNGWSTEATWMVHSHVSTNEAELAAWQAKGKEYADNPHAADHMANWISMRLFRATKSRVKVAAVGVDEKAAGLPGAFWEEMITAGLNAVNYQELGCWVMEMVTDLISEKQDT